MKVQADKRSQKMAFIMIGLILGSIILMLLPIWEIQTITISNHSYYTEEDILKTAGIQSGMHVLSFRKHKVKRKIEALTYIKEAEIAYQFPYKLTINVIESTPIGYVPFSGTYLCLDKEGYVLEQMTNKVAKLPMLEGLKFEKFIIGEKILFENEENFLTLREILHKLRKYDYVEQIDNIDISDIEQIHLYVDKLDVIIGNMRDFDKKMEYLIQIHKSYTMGILDLSFIQNGQAILRPLT